MLGSPFDLLAAAQGFSCLATVLNCLGGYQGVVLSAHRSWLDRNEATAASLIEVFENARVWASSGENRATLLTILAKGLPETTATATVAAIAERLFGAGSEFCPGGALSSDDLAEVVRLYAKYRKIDLGGFEVTQAVDPRFCQVPS